MNTTIQDRWQYTYKLRKRVRVIHALLTIVLTFSTYGALIYAWNENHQETTFWTDLEN